MPQKNNRNDRNPLTKNVLRLRDRKHELAFLKSQTDDAIIAICTSVPDFEFLKDLYSFYIHRDHPDTLQLSFGKRPMAGLTIDQSRTACEQGPSLLYSMGPDGTIATILYPAKSDLSSVHEDHLFLGLGATSGMKLKDGMRNDIRDLVAYAHVSSLQMDATWGEKMRIGALRITRPRGRDGSFERAPIWSNLLGFTNFVTRTTATAGVMAMFRPVGIAIALIALVWFGFDEMAQIVKAMVSAK